MKKTLVTPHSRMILSMLIFGTVGLFVRAIPLPSSLIACARGVIGALFIYLFMKLRGQRVDLAAIRKNAVMLLLSGAALGFNWVFLFEAYRYTTVATATLCYYLAPVIVMLLSPFLLREKLTLRRLACCLVSLLGMVFVSGAATGAVPTSAELTGILWGVGSAALYACVMLLNKKLYGIKAQDRTVVQLSVSAAFMLVYALLTEKQLSFALSPIAAGMLLTVGILHTGVAYLCYFGALKDMKAQSAAILSYIDPVAAILLSFIVLGEALTWQGALGAVMILSSALLSEIKGKRE